MATLLRALSPVVVLLCLACASPAGAANPRPAVDPFADLFAPSKPGRPARPQASPTSRHRPNLARMPRPSKGGQAQSWSRLQPVNHANPEAGELLLSDYAPGRHALAGP
jgi:hypothetical protein